MRQTIARTMMSFCCAISFLLPQAHADDIDNLKHRVHVDFTNGGKLLTAEKYGEAFHALTAAANTSHELAEELAYLHRQNGHFDKAAQLYAQLGHFDKSAKTHEHASRLASQRGLHDIAKEHLAFAKKYREHLEDKELPHDVTFEENASSWDDQTYTITRPINRK